MSLEKFSEYEAFYLIVHSANSGIVSCRGAMNYITSCTPNFLECNDNRDMLFSEFIPSGKFWRSPFSCPNELGLRAHSLEITEQVKHKVVETTRTWYYPQERLTPYGWSGDHISFRDELKLDSAKKIYLITRLISVRPRRLSLTNFV